MFNIMNTLYPEKLEAYINHARDMRHTATDEEQKGETIMISSDWLKQLNAIPFASSKYHSSV